MSAASGAYGVHAGFNQSGGGYYTIVSALTAANFLTYTPGTGSGGAATAGTFAAYNYALDLTTDTSTLVTAAGNLLKDMGKTVVSSGRTFRKFQAVFPASQNAFGVGGQSAPYVTGYLEVSREGTGTVVNRIARMA